MYESPIKIEFSDPVFEQLRNDADEYILKACQKMVASVDKDELVKALQYDRDQYRKGFSDGKLWKPPIVTNADKFRSMSDEDLAWAIVVGCTGRQCPESSREELSTIEDAERVCQKCWLDWLRQEAL